MSLDTSYQTDFLTAVLSNNLLNQYAIKYADNNRKQLAGFKSPEAFVSGFNSDLMPGFLSYIKTKQVSPTEKERKATREYLQVHLKALVARQLYRDEGYFRVINQTDPYIRKALEAMSK